MIKPRINTPSPENKLEIKPKIFCGIVVVILVAKSSSEVSASCFIFSKSIKLELSKLLKGMNCYVNLIPYNETSHIEFKKSDQDTILKFYDTLKKNNIGVTIRREFGKKVSAACGQLRANYKEE